VVSVFDINKATCLRLGDTRCFAQTFAAFALILFCFRAIHNEPPRPSRTLFRGEDFDAAAFIFKALHEFSNHNRNVHSPSKSYAGVKLTDRHTCQKFLPKQLYCSLPETTDVPICASYPSSGNAGSAKPEAGGCTMTAGASRILRYDDGKFRRAQWIMTFLPVRTCHAEQFDGAVVWSVLVAV
jgi:hypothetical protein